MHLPFTVFIQSPGFIVWMRQGGVARLHLRMKRRKYRSLLGYFNRQLKYLPIIISLLGLGVSPPPSLVALWMQWGPTSNCLNQAVSTFPNWKLDSRVDWMKVNRLSRGKTFVPSIAYSGWSQFEYQPKSFRYFTQCHVRLERWNECRSFPSTPLLSPDTSSSSRPAGRATWKSIVKQPKNLFTPK